MRPRVLGSRPNGGQSGRYAVRVHRSGGLWTRRVASPGDTHLRPVRLSRAPSIARLKLLVMALAHIDGDRHQRRSRVVYGVDSHESSASPTSAQQVSEPSSPKALSLVSPSFTKRVSGPGSPCTSSAPPKPKIVLAAPSPKSTSDWAVP